MKIMTCLICGGTYKPLVDACPHCMIIIRPAETRKRLPTRKFIRLNTDKDAK